MNKFRINYESDLENPVPSGDMVELLEQNLYACVSDAVLSFLANLGGVSFYEDNFTLETNLSEELFIEKVNAHELFRRLGIKIRIE